MLGSHPRAQASPSKKGMSHPSPHWAKGQFCRNVPLASQWGTLIITLPHYRPVQIPSQSFFVVQSCREVRQSYGLPFTLLKVARVSSCHSGKSMNMGHGATTKENVEQHRTGTQPCLTDHEAPPITNHKGPHLSLLLVRPQKQDLSLTPNLPTLLLSQHCELYLL